MFVGSYYNQLINDNDNIRTYISKKQMMEENSLTEKY